MRLVKIFNWVIAPLLVAAILLAILNQRAINDWWFLRSYTPPPEIAALSHDAHLTDTGQRYFYVSAPELLSKPEFITKCVFSEFSIVVGCYDGQDIYILDIDNDELDDGEIVTAAHEMLHAAYDRMSQSEKNEINEMVLRDVEAVNDPDVLETIELYREHVDDDSFANELHSILGTEVYNLSPQLEEYYSQYFSDRKALVDIAQAYDEVFTELEAKVNDLADELNKLVISIDLQSAALTDRFKELEAQRAVLQTKIDNHVQSPTLVAEIEEFEDEVNRYNSDVKAYRDDLARYQELRSEYEELVVHHEELIKSIESDVVPVEIAE